MNKSAAQFPDSDALKTRMIFYQGLSVLFCQPEKEFLSDPAFFDAFLNVSKGFGDEAGIIIRQLNDSALLYSTDELLIEYTRLFIGPFKAPAPPYSSYYLDKNKLLNSQITRWVLDYYQGSGYDFDRKLYELPDHFVIETEFLYLMCFHQLEGLEKDDASQVKQYRDLEAVFFNRHYRVWTSLFSTQVLESTANSFYKNAAKLIMLKNRQD